jgi:hypothetical protein
MASAKNKVIAGDYEGKNIVGKPGMKHPVIALGMIKSIPMNNETVETYELITDEHVKSAASGVARGLVGGALFGAVGMLAGVSSGKNKGIFQVAVQFKDGKKSLIEIDDQAYKALVKACF